MTLFCVAEGEPKPTIRWTRNGAAIDSSRYNISINGVHLTLSAIEEKDAGRFACIATSPYGEISRTFDVKVSCKFQITVFKFSVYLFYIIILQTLIFPSIP